MSDCDILLDRYELAWAGGFFDGEGCTSYCEIDGKRRSPRLQVAIGNTNLQLLEKFQHAVGGLGKIYSCKLIPGRKPMWTWNMSGFVKPQAAIAILWKFLSDEKRAQATKAFHHYHVRRKECKIEVQERNIYRGIRTHCPHGHPYSGDNLYIVPSRGHRQCRTCTRLRNKRFRDQRRLNRITVLAEKE